MIMRLASDYGVYEGDDGGQAVESINAVECEKSTAKRSPVCRVLADVAVRIRHEAD